MPIALDISAATQQSAGIARYEIELVRAMRALDPRRDFIGVYNRQPGARVPAALAGLPTRTLGLSNRLWRLAILAAYALHRPWGEPLREVDLFHGLDYIAPPLRAPVVITVHDLSFRLFPQYHTLFNRWYLNLAVPRAARSARAVLVDSAHTGHDLAEWLHLPPEKIHVIPLGVSPAYRPVQDPKALAETRRLYNLPDTFLLFVGTLEPRKNLANLIEAYRQLRAQGFAPGLVVVGKKGWGYDAFAASLENTPGVVRPGWVDEGDLPALYSAATALVMPSWYEGFGLPVLEAMACGTPVIASSAASLREVAGEAALLVAPDEVRAWGEAIRRVTTDAALHAALAARGLAHAAGFTWERTARRTLEVYEHLS